MSEQIITIVKTQYENSDFGKKLVITDSDGKQWKIPEKRQGLWPIAEQNKTVILTISAFQGNNYISEIKPAVAKNATTQPAPQPIQQTPPQTSSAAPEAKTMPIATPAVLSDRDKSIVEQVAFKGLIELGVAQLLTEGEMLALKAWAWDKMGVGITEAKPKAVKKAEK
jgi:hypothetical protein